MRDVLVFEVAGQRYGLFAREVREVLRAAAITSLPEAPAVVEGILNVRGAVLPVYDLRARFGLPARALDPDEHFIVADAGARRVVVRVDRTLELAAVPEDGWQETPFTLPGGAGAAGVAALEEGLVLIHDLAAFLTEAEAASLDAALLVHPS
jgi:purine-binding chemotaxis protein CheW